MEHETSTLPPVLNLNTALLFADAGLLRLVPGITGPRVLVMRSATDGTPIGDATRIYGRNREKFDLVRADEGTWACKAGTVRGETLQLELEVAA